jgi:short-subunit dehydrogenase
MKHHYFVTGAAGFIGRHLCRRLIGRGDMVTALARSETAAFRDMPSLRVLRGDIRDTRLYAAALAEATVIIHLAADARFGNGPGYDVANVETTAILLDAVARHASRLSRFVFVSTIGAVDRRPGDQCHAPLDEDSPPAPTSDYGRSKLAAEDLVRRSGLPFAVVRPGMVVGRDMRRNSHFAVFSRLAAAGSAFTRIAWPGALSVIGADDLAEALITVAEHPEAASGTFFAAGEPVRLADAFNHVRLCWRLPIAWIVYVLRPAARLLPFPAKMLLFPALVASDGHLRQLGWAPHNSGLQALDGVIDRERRHQDPRLAPGGRTLVTGAASGLGRAIAERLAVGDRRLVLLDRDGPGLEQVARHGVNVERVVCDLADPAAIKRFLASPAWTGQGPGDDLVEVFACAGFGLRGAFTELALDRQLTMLQVDLSARLTLCHHAAATMRRLQFGRIVLISSSSAFQPLPYMSLYAAINAALLRFGEGLALELENDGIEVLTVCPGGMKTAFQKQAGVREVPGERLAEPEDVAEAIMAALGRGRVVIVPSVRALLMDLTARLLPRSLTRRLWTRLMAKLR